jgi:hypothetical protein
MSIFFQRHGRARNKYETSVTVEGAPKIEVKVEPSRTMQSYKDQCDINKILSRFQKTGAMDHLTKHGAVYGDFADFDFQTHMQQLTRGREIFDELPSEVRKEFGQSPQAFFDFVNDPENKDRLAEVLPAIAEPGSYFPDVSSSTPPDATMDPNTTVSEPPPSSEGGETA